jgi:hypothetical protein
VGAIQLQMVRRNEDRKKLSEQIAKLEAEVGLAQGEAKWGAIAPAYCAVTNSRSVQYG